MRLLIAPLLGLAITISVFFAEQSFLYWNLVSRWQEPLLFLGGLMAGIRWPDWDFGIPGLTHRSGVTHSFLLPLVVYWLALPATAAGLALGIALHLSSDIQPRAWTGGALVKLPYIGSIGSKLSPVWLFANMVGCLAIMSTALEIEPESARIIMLMVMSAGIFWYFSREEKKRLLPLGTLAVSSFLAFSIRTGSVSWELFAQLFT